MTAPLMILSRGGSLNAWELSATEARYFPGDPAPARDPQNYKYVNGFVDVGDLPCRVATWREVATRSVTLNTDWPVESLYLPGSNRRVEFSQFRHRPTRLARWCRTRLAAPQDRYCSFTLTTRGGVHIWVDGILAARFEPYTRNQDQATVVHLPIRATGSEIVVLTEDMAERDTNWFFELVLRDDVALEVHLPGARMGDQVDALTALARQVRTAGDVVDADGTLTLLFDTPVAMPVTVQVRIASTSHTHALLLDRTLALPAGATELAVCRGSELPDGAHIMPLVFRAGEPRVDRTIACAILHQTRPAELGGSLFERKRLALEHAAMHGETRMGTAIALLETGRADDPRLRPILEDTLVTIEERRDCADFVAVPLLWAMMRHGAALPPDLQARSRQALLDFRYWVDEPGNDVMWFWSENHALCFHVSQLLAGLTWPDATFTASGRSGQQQAQLAEQRLDQWFDSVEEEGLAEWNSAAYYPVDFIGLLALAELAPAHLARRASALCDRLFTMIALHTLDGVPAGSMGRAYDKELRAGPLTELAPFAAVAFGKGWFNTGVASLPMFASGRYEPPANLGRYVDPEPGTVVSAHYLQGYGPAARLSLYKTAHVQMSSNSGAKAGGYGHQQHVLDLRFAGHPMARAWINHPGEDDPWGQQRPSFWAGNGNLPRVAQSDNVALLLYRLDSPARLPFTHAYAARAGLDHHLRNGMLILRSAGALVGLVATNPLHAVSSGPSAGLEYRCEGEKAGWAVIAGQTTDLDAFARYLAACRLSLDGSAARLTLERPEAPDLALDWTQGLLIGGAVAPAMALTAEPSVTIRAAADQPGGSPRSGLIPDGD